MGGREVKRSLVIGALLLTWLAACSPVPTPSPAAPTPAPDEGGTQAETITASPELPAPPSPTLPASTAIAATWEHLNLTGQLVFIMAAQDPQNPAGFTPAIVRLDLASGALTTIFEAPANAWVTAASVSPDGKQMLMAYAPPPEPGQVQFGYTGLYSLPTDGTVAPQALLDHDAQNEAYFHPSWSPDGHYIYYAHFNLVEDSDGFLIPLYGVERLPYPGGHPERIVGSAYWPRLSSDSSKLAYVSLDPVSYTNTLMVADADGQRPFSVALPETFIVDAALFSPDGEFIVFSAADMGAPPPQSWLDSLFGVQVAEAHNVPSDWFRIPVSGGQPERLTEIGESGLYADFSPDGRRMAFVSLGGLFVLDPDSKELSLLVPNLGGYGTVDWIP